MFGFWWGRVWMDARHECWVWCENILFYIAKGCMILFLENLSSIKIIWEKEKRWTKMLRNIITKKFLAHWIMMMGITIILKWLVHWLYHMQWVFHFSIQKLFSLVCEKLKKKCLSSLPHLFFKGFLVLCFVHCNVAHILMHKWMSFSRYQSVFLIV